mgnify:CR=1 FL=1
MIDIKTRNEIVKSLITSIEQQDSNIDTKEGLRITFKGLLPKSPKQLGLSQDDRQIAIGLESIQLR